MNERLRTLWQTLLHEHTSPSRVAFAVWLGGVVGCTPFFGLHLPLCIALAWLLRLNKLIVYAAANISLPPFAALLGFASVQLGMRLMQGTWPGLDLQTFRDRPLVDNAKLFFGAWLLGGALIGAAIGGLLALVAYAIARGRGDVFSAAVRRASRRYRACDPKYRYYAFFKYRMDPVYRRVAQHVPPGSHTVDFGAGLNMLGVVLHELGENRRATGLEWDADKVQAARNAAPEIAIEQSDVREPLRLPPADVVTIVDMLHYFSRADVDKILQQAEGLLQREGTLLIRESDKSHGSRWTRLLERTAVAIGWNTAPGVRFLSRQELEERVKALGFSVEAQPVAGPLHPGNVLYVCRRYQPAPAP